MVYYLVTRSGTEAFVKIGYTEGCPWVRMAEVGLGCPFPLELLGLERGGYAEERLQHRRFARLRVRGEWFRLQGALIDHIVNLPTPDRYAWHQGRRMVTQSRMCRDCRNQFDEHALEYVINNQFNGMFKN